VEGEVGEGVEGRVVGVGLGERGREVFVGVEEVGWCAGGGGERER
jgi:hypothetical protein